MKVKLNVRRERFLMNEDIIEKALNRIERGKIVELAKDLIRIPSMTGHERQVAEHISRFFEERGFSVDNYGTMERPIVVSHVNNQSTPLLVFNGHVDTVPIADPSAWNQDPFKPMLIENRLYGRGSCDMKGSCAVILHVMEILRDLSDDGAFTGAVGAQLVPDEECGGIHGTVRLIELIKQRKLRRPEYVVMGEKSNLQIRIAERGILSFVVRFKGKATHTAYARLEGVNPIAKAARGVLALEKHIEKYHPFIGHPVVSVNMIRAGKALSQVPAECVIDVDRRIIIGETKESVLKEVKETLDEAGKDDPDWRYTIEVLKDERGIERYAPANITDPEAKLVKVFQDAMRKVMGKEPVFFVEWAGGTDGRHYRQVGIQTVNFGPSGEHFHGPNEFVYVDSLEIQAKVYLVMSLQLL